MRTAALIVSHNRSNLLRECLDALSSQTAKLTDIVVVDNCSTDGTEEMLSNIYPHVIVLQTQANRGGAGGFSLGIQYLIQQGYDLAWLMDDDACPDHDAFEPLINAMAPDGRIDRSTPGFVASNVLTRDDFKDYPWRYPKPHRTITTQTATPVGTIPVGFAVFVGVLINLHVAKTTYLPVSDFFLWWDDTEYTSRLQLLAGGFYSPESVVRHPLKPELKDLGERLHYDLRNRIWIIRDRRLGSRTSLAKARGALWWRIRHQATNARSKRRFAYYLARGVIDGIFTKPRLEMPVTRITPDSGGA